MIQRLNNITDYKAKGWVYHALALIVFMVWGSTFISTRILLKEGLSPTEIFGVRALIAYIVLLLFYPKRVAFLPWRDEGAMAVLGIMGGSLFFWVQNTALLYTSTTNVALLVCTAPLLTALLASVWQKKTMAWQLWFGGIVTMLGIVLVVFNGQWGQAVINLKGDFLAFSAALAWAVYQLVLKGVSNRYPALLITRKVFFYGLITLLPYFALVPQSIHTSLYTNALVWGNILYLSLGASLLCFWLWTIVVERMGAVRSAYYIYLNPIVAMITVAWVLGENITLQAIAGTLLVLVGVYCSEYKKVR